MYVIQQTVAVAMAPQLLQDEWVGPFGYAARGVQGGTVRTFFLNKINRQDLKTPPHTPKSRGTKGKFSYKSLTKVKLAYSSA